MNKTTVLDSINPQAMTKALAQKLPQVDVASLKATSERTGKAVRGWWDDLPNDGVRWAIPVGAALVVGLTVALAVYLRRR